MPNSFYNAGSMTAYTRARAGHVNTQLLAIEEAFDAVETLIGGTNGWAVLRYPEGEDGETLPASATRASKIWGSAADGSFKLFTPADAGSDPRFDEIEKGVPVVLEPTDDETDNEAFARFRDIAIADKRPLFIPYRATPWEFHTHGQNDQVVSGDADPTNIGNLRSGLVIIFGQGAQVTPDPDHPYCLFYNPVGEGTVPTPNEKDYTHADALLGFKIIGGEFIDDVETLGFSPFKAFIHVNCVHRFEVKDTRFIGWRGDAIHIGAGDRGGGIQMRHNKLVSIYRCFFDGINQNQRNAISVIDCEDFSVDKCIFKNCTKPGGVGALDLFDAATGESMPGAIDFEPNASDFNIRLGRTSITNNTFENIGTGGMVYYLLPMGMNNPNGKAWGTASQNHLCTGNHFIGCGRGITVGGYNTDTGNTLPYNILITANTFTGCTYDIRMFESYGVAITNNLFENSNATGNIGFLDSDGSYAEAVAFIGNVHRLCGGDGIGALAIFGLKNGSFIGNLYEDCSGTGLCFLNDEYTFERISINNNTWIATPGASKTMANYIISAATYGTPVFDFTSIIFGAGNDVGGLVQFGFPAPGTEVSAMPTTGRYLRGATLKSRFLAPGEPTGYYCTHSFVDADPPDIPSDIEARWVVTGYNPGIEDDPAPTTALTLNLSSGMTHSAGRFTATDGGWEYGVTTTGLAHTGGVEIIFRAPRSDTVGVHVGVTTDSTPTALADAGFTVWCENGTINTKSGASPYDIEIGTCEYGQEIRFVAAAGVYAIFTTDPTTGVEVELALGNDIFGMTGTLYLVVGVNDSEGATFFVDKFGTP